jgi:outer membrane receptor protein involved in Fe transport
MTVKNQRFFLRCVLTLALLTGMASVQALTLLTGTTSVQTLVMLAGMTAAQTTDENEDIDTNSLGLNLSDLFNLEVSIATGVKQSVARAPSVTSVITAKDIEAIGATDLSEVLQTVPGLHVEVSPYAYTSMFVIRGMNTAKHNPHVLLLINGIPITRLHHNNRGWLWGGMQIAAIDHLEIIRGPGSALYGAEAFSGVINIVTKTKESIEGTEIGSRTGSFGTGEIWALHGGNYGGFDVAMTLEGLTTDGYEAILEADAQTALDKIYDTKASLAPGPIPLQRKAVEARLDVSKGHWRLRSGYQGRYDVGSGAGVSLDPRAQFRDDRFNTDLTWHNPNLTDNWDIKAQASYYYNRVKTKDQTFYPPGAYGGKYPNGYIADSSLSERHTRLELTSFYSGFKKHLIGLGTGYHLGDSYDVKFAQNTNPITGEVIPPGEPFFLTSGTIYEPYGEMARDDWHVFLQDIWSISANFELTAGIRYDSYSDFGSTVNPRGALVWQPHPDITAKLLYGSAFRPPSQADLLTKNAIWETGNPNLEPETVKTWETAFDYKVTDTLHLATNLYYFKWEDGIILASDTHGGISGLAIKNAGIQKGHGLELEARWKITKKSSLLANYAYSKVNDDKLQHDAGGYPQHSIYIRTDWLLYPKWYLNTQVNWIGEMKRTLSDPRPPLDSYTTVDLTLRRKDIHQGHWNFATSVRNLLDADVLSPSAGPNTSGNMRNPYDFPLAGRSYWVELRYNF